MKAAAVLVAAGRSERMGGVEGSKVYACVAGRALLAHALLAFDRHPDVAQVVLVVAAGDEPRLRREVLERFPPQTPFEITSGGTTRQDSVRRGLACVEQDVPLVLVHDGARPFVSQSVIERVLAAAKAWGAALPVVALHDSVKRVDATGQVVESPDRAQLFRAQTPQGFRLDVLRRSLDEATKAGRTFSDDAAAVQHYAGLHAKTVPGDPSNFKVTTPFDLTLATCLHSHLI